MKILLCGELNLVKTVAEYLGERGHFLIVLIERNEKTRREKWGKDFFIWETEEIIEEVSDNLINNVELLILLHPYQQEKQVERLISSPSLKGKFVILANSYYIYGKPRILPASEDSALYPEEERGWKELIIEDKLKFYAYKLHYSPIILRTGEVYGPALEGWISQSIRDVLSNKEIVLWGEGEGIFDLLYVQDFLQFLEKTIESKEKLKGETINVANGRGISLKTIARKILSLANREENFIKFSHLPPPFPQVTLSPSKARILLSWVPRYTADRGVHITFTSIEKEGMSKEEDM